MKKEEIYLDDWARILLGEVPVSFLLELVIRAAVVYLILMIAMRGMGKRMSSQLSRNELAALVSLAAAVGVPMMAPDRGLLPAVVIALVLVGIERIITKWAFKNQSFERLSQGNISTLVKNAVIDVLALERADISRERLFAQLRSLGVTQLGNVKRLYMEANGSFTLVQNESPQPGLPTLPGWDKTLNTNYEAAEDIRVCGFCGQVNERPLNNSSPCPNCKKVAWMQAIKNVKF
jgi:uncharacterized membrane protein YcaP (DUF421 family)